MEVMFPVMMWTWKTSRPAGPYGLRAPYPRKTSPLPVRRKQRGWQHTPQPLSWSPRSALNQRTNGMWTGATPGVGAARNPLTPSLSQRPSTKAARLHRGAAPRAVEPRRPGARKSPTEDPSGGREEGKDEQGASSESDPEGPIAAQMLSFVMDDPDFESDSDPQRRVVRRGLGAHSAWKPWGWSQAGMAGRRKRQATLFWGRSLR